MSPAAKKGGSQGSRQPAAKRAAREAAQRRRRRMLATAGAIVLVVGLIGALAFVGAGDDDGSEVATDDSPETSEPAPSGEFTYGSGPCPPAEKPAQRPTSFADAPQKCTEDGVDYSAEVVTSEGAFVIDLLEEGAPGTVNNFVVLARHGWFDGDDFHRVVPGFVIQAGDPVGDPPGTGGPGYTIPDELDITDGYPEGAVAMAKTSAPDSAGSQWFVCTDCSVLPPEYSLFGQVVEGMDVVKRINDLGQPDQTPSRPVAITSVEIREA